MAAALETGRFHSGRFLHRAMQNGHPGSQLPWELNLPASYLAGTFNAQGPNANCTTACVSSSQAIGEATEIIRRGEADVMLCGGAHSMIHPFGLTGFCRLSVLSTRNDPAAMRPFDRDRDGFVVGEGAAMIVLEELEHARRRGAEIWGELAGYASTQNAFRITDSHPQGRGTSACIRQALDDARLNPDDLDYINAHGTSTTENDKIETLSIKKACGRRAHRIPISSTKSMLGHLTTACGAMELIACLMTLRSGVIHPTINYQTPDPECDLDYVPNTAREAACRHVVSNSFGFGGQNVVLVVSRG
jgi:3-oxoacyl-[acyl-carrier-protein] synthase II